MFADGAEPWACWFAEVVKFIMLPKDVPLGFCATVLKKYWVFAVNPEIFILLSTCEFPPPKLRETVVLPKDCEMPYSNQVFVLEPFGLIEPSKVAELVVIPKAELVFTVGAELIFCWFDAVKKLTVFPKTVPLLFCATAR